MRRREALKVFSVAPLIHVGTELPWGPSYESGDEPLELLFDHDMTLLAKDDSFYDPHALKPTQQVSMTFNSRGGDVCHALAIANIFSRCRITAQASVVIGAALLPFAACVNRIANKESNFGFLSCSTVALTDHRKTLHLLDTVDNHCAQYLSRRIDLSQNDVLSLMRQETWMGAIEAQRIGLVTEIC